MEHLVFEVGLALALIAAMALLAAKLRFSSVPLLILTGMVVGPHIPKMGMVDLRFLNSAPLLSGPPEKRTGSRGLVIYREREGA